MRIICALVYNDGTLLDEPMGIPVDAKMSVWELAKSASSIFPTISTSGLHPWSLTMWKLTEPFPLDLDDLIPGHVKNLRLNSVGGGGNPKAIKLAQGHSLTHYFEFESLSQEHVSLVIQLPEEDHSSMVARRIQEGIAQAPTRNELLAPMKKFSRKSRYTNDPPSYLALEYTCFVNQNNDEERILNDRPVKDVGVVPIALLYSPFGQFLDRMHDSPEDEDDGVDIKNLEFAVEEFAVRMSCHYRLESQRQVAVVEDLNKIFSSNTSTVLPEIQPGLVFENRPSAGHARGPTGALETIVEVKNKLGAGLTDPEVQLTSYFAQAHTMEISNEGYDDLYERFLFPTLGISIIGPYVGFGALVYLDKPRFVGLTPLLSTRFPSGDDSARTALVRAFRAACILRADIHHDTIQAVEHLSNPLLGRNFPYVHKVSAWRSTPGNADELDFHLVRDMFPGKKSLCPNRFIYEGRWGNELIVVKFTRRYCPQLHHFCAEQGHAPKLLGYGTIPGGWHVVVMGAMGEELDLEEHGPRYYKKWEMDLTKLVQGFHDKGLVHGDLRRANITVSKEDPGQIILFDFDWGGDVGKASFPTWLLNKDLTEEMKTLKITKEHDNRVLLKALDVLRYESMPETASELEPSPMPKKPRKE